MRVRGTDRAARVPLPRRAIAGTAGGKALEAVTLAGLVLLVPRALGAADYGAFAVALAVATGIATATGIGGPALFARVLGPARAPAARRALARALVRRVGRTRAAVLLMLAATAGAGAALAPGSVSAPQVALVTAAAVLGTAATLLSQLALGLERTIGWSLRYPLENGVTVAGSLVLYPVAGVNGAIAAIALGAAAALGLGLVTAWPELRGSQTGTLPAGTVRFARLQAGSGALTQVVHRGAAPACALLGATAAATGHAAIAAGAALAITYAVLQTTLVALPGAARAYAGDRAGAEAALWRVAGLCTAVVIPACAFLALAAEPLLTFALGESFRDAAEPLRIGLAAAALAPLWALATQLAALRGRPEAALVGAALGAASFVWVAVLAVPDGEASGAAAAMLAGVAATVAGTLAALRVRRAEPA
jgi:O-antigen/teichoic acid export membrane protein